LAAADHAHHHDKGGHPADHNGKGRHLRAQGGVVWSAPQEVGVSKSHRRVEDDAVGHKVASLDVEDKNSARDDQDRHRRRHSDREGQEVGGCSLGCDRWPHEVAYCQELENWAYDARDLSHHTGEAVRQRPIRLADRCPQIRQRVQVVVSISGLEIFFDPIRANLRKRVYLRVGQGRACCESRDVSMRR
jgi:hypothetical protein